MADEQFAEDLPPVGINPDSQLATQPQDLPSISPKAGWRTSQGQLTALFSIAALVLSWFGIKTDADQITNIYELIMNIVESIGPLLALIPVLMTYINSRGKIQSNAINASAALSTPPLGLTGVGSILKSIGGGKNWKDPARYGKILEIVNSTGALGPAGKVIDGVMGSNDSGEVEEIVEVLKNHEDRIAKLEK